MKKTLGFGIAALIALVVFLMTACDDGAVKDEEKEPGVISIKVVPNNYIVYRGYEQTFLAEVSGTGDKAVTWSIVEQDDLHKNTIIDQNGLLSVSPDEEQTILTIKAVLAADPDKYGTAKVSIPAPTVTGVEINLAAGVVVYPWFPKNKAIDVDSDNTEQFYANVVGENFPDQDVTWSITGTVSSGTSINAAGLLTVSPNEAAGAQFTVKAASKVDPGKSDIITVTVQPPVISYFTVVPGRTTISSSVPVEFAVTVLGTGNIRGPYELEWAVERSDRLALAQDEAPYYDELGELVHIRGTRFEGNTLYMGPEEKLGDWEGEEGEGIYTPLPAFSLVVTVTLTPTLPVSANLPTSVEILLTPEDSFVASGQLEY